MPSKDIYLSTLQARAICHDLGWFPTIDFFSALSQEVAIVAMVSLVPTERWNRQACWYICRYLHEFCGPVHLATDDFSVRAARVGLEMGNHHVEESSCLALTAISQHVLVPGAEVVVIGILSRF